MKGQIILPIFYKTRYTDNYKFLLKAIADKYGLSYEYTDNPIIKKDTELVITFAIPQHNKLDKYPWQKFLNLPKHIKLIAWLRDIHCYDNPDCHLAICAMMDRADIIVSNLKSYFLHQYPEYVDKMFFMGDFFAPHERYAMGICRTSWCKCLLSGAVSKKSYPLRNQILFEKRVDLIDFLLPPYHKTHDFVGDKYARLLYSYFCCVTASGIYNGVVSKHMEIPAAGSLLITNVGKDLIDLGYVSMKHFVPIDKDNAIDIIQQVLNEPLKFQHIREEGYRFVHENHGLNNRIKELSGLIERVMKGDYGD